MKHEQIRLIKKRYDKRKETTTTGITLYGSMYLFSFSFN